MDKPILFHVIFSVYEANKIKSSIIFLFKLMFVLNLLKKKRI